MTSRSTRGVYPHLLETGQAPTKADLLKYGVAINLPDRIMYTLNEVYEPVALPLNLDLRIANYVGYGVPLKGKIPKDVEEHVKLGNVRNVADILTHIFYSRPISNEVTIFSSGTMYHPIVIDLTASARTFSISRVIRDGANYLEVTDNSGAKSYHTAPEAVFDPTVDLAIRPSDNRTVFVAAFSQADRNLQSGKALLNELADTVKLSDNTLDAIVRLRPSSNSVASLGIKIGLVHHRYGTPILNTYGRPYFPVEVILNPT